MTETTTGCTPTDEDVARVVAALPWAGMSHTARDVLGTIGPIVERERRAAKVEALNPVLELLAQWRNDRLGYPLDDPRASVAFIAVKQCEEELRAAIERA